MTFGTLDVISPEQCAHSVSVREAQDCRFYNLVLFEKAGEDTKRDKSEASRLHHLLTVASKLHQFHKLQGVDNISHSYFHGDSSSL